MTEVHHIAMVVRDLDEALAAFDRLLGAGGAVDPDPTGRARIAFVRLANCELELVQPLTDDHPMMEFLRTNGPGLHHVALAVDDAGGAAAELARRGAALSPPWVGPGARGSRIGNLAPEALAGARFQIVEPARD